MIYVVERRIGMFQSEQELEKMEGSKTKNITGTDR
jgi:hypothetical protein